MDGRFFAKRKLRSYYWDGVTNFSLQDEQPIKPSTRSSHRSGDGIYSGEGSGDGGCNSLRAEVDTDNGSDENDSDWEEREEQERLEEFRQRFCSFDDGHAAENVIRRVMLQS
jgi:hypothetical protein